MAKAEVFGLANRILSTHGSFVSNIRRIQGGFLTERNLKEAREVLREFSHTLDQIEQSIHNPNTSKQPSDSYVPLK
jgi:hypothetical protein